VELESVRALKVEAQETILGSEWGTHAARRRRLRVEGLDRIFSRIPGRGSEVEMGSSPAIALGIAAGEGESFSLAVRVQDRRALDGPAIERIKRSAAGEVDIRYIGRPVPAALSAWHRSRCEPMRSGTSIGSEAQRTTGSLGCFVEPEEGGPLHLVSNSHVLAGWGKGHRGDEILQPGWDDQGRRHPAVANLAELVDLRSKQVSADDCAVAELVEPSAADVTPGLETVGPQVGEAVSKDGRTTGSTKGNVLAMEVGPVEMDYPRPLGRLVFDELIEVEGEGALRFADRGDSGAVVFAGSSQVLGLLFAVTRRGGHNGRGVAYLAPFDRVLRSLKMRLVP
jgi:hypothetical protein